MIETERLRLRPWREADLAPFHALCNDPVVMRFLGPPLSSQETEAFVARQKHLQRERGHCFWVIEGKADRRFLGFCGLKPGPEATPIAEQVEIGWRLASDRWGEGLAREAAQACLGWAWTHVDTPGVAAITVRENTRSWGLMERLGMTRQRHEDFAHPAVPEGDPLRPHIVYRIARPR
jgi:RimJ/RimL family protein N-acetyltransferase